MASSPEDFLSGFYEQYAGSKPKPAFATAKKLIKQGLVDPTTAAEEFAAKGAAAGWKSGKIERGFRRLSKLPYGVEALSKYEAFNPLVESTYQDLYGRSATPEDIQNALGSAQAARVSSSDPGAFQSFLMDRMMTSQEGMQRVKTPKDIEAERLYGTMTRDAEGNLVRGQYLFRPDVINAAVQGMLGRS